MKRVVLAALLAVFSRDSSALDLRATDLNEDQVKAIVAAVGMKGFPCKEAKKVSTGAIFSPIYFVTCDDKLHYEVELVETAYGVKPRVRRVP